MKHFMIGLVFVFAVVFLNLPAQAIEMGKIPPTVK